MKKLVSLLLAVCTLACLAGCGNNEGGVDFNPGAFESDTGGDEPVASVDIGDETPAPAVNEDDLIYPDDDGEAIGYVGDTLRTAFFDMRLNSAYSCHEFDGLTADEGYKFVVAEITLYNYTSYTVPMFDTDFEVWWDVENEEDAENAWSIPLSEEVEDGEYETLSDLQLPVEYNLPIRGTETGKLLYQVPEDAQDYFLVFVEIFQDDSYGDSFYVRFSAPSEE